MNAKEFLEGIKILNNLPENLLEKIQICADIKNSENDSGLKNSAEIIGTKIIAEGSRPPIIYLIVDNYGRNN